MTGLAERAKGLGGSRNLWLVPALILLGIVYPFIEEGLSDLPLIGDFMPSTGTLVVMIAFTMMAVGLNIVVGYCGLLDLGYVAFYAVGAYTAGWLASQHFERGDAPLRLVGRQRPRRHPHDDVDRPDRRRAPDDARRHHHRPPDAAPARRLPGDRHARLRRDHPAGRPQRRQLRRLQPHERHVRDRAHRPGRLPAPQRARAARQLPDLGQSRALVLPGRAPAPALHDLLLRPAAGLAARARVDRDPRGRDRGRRDGRAR